MAKYIVHQPPKPLRRGRKNVPSDGTITDTSAKNKDRIKKFDTNQNEQELEMSYHTLE